MVEVQHACSPLLNEALCDSKNPRLEHTSRLFSFRLELKVFYKKKNVRTSGLKQVVADCSQQVPYAAERALHTLSSCTINYVSKQC